MASFGSNTFKERGENAQFFPLFGRKAEISITKIDGGDRVLIQSAGLGEERMDLAIRCTASELAALKNAVDTTKTLTWSGGTRSAYLEAVDSPREVLASGKIFATLKLIGR